NASINVLPGTVTFEGLAELQHKVVPEILRNKTSVIYPTDYLSLSRQDRHLGIFQKAIEHQVGLLRLRERKAHMSTPFRRAQLGLNAIIKRYSIIMRLGSFIGMAEGQRPLVF